MNSLWQVAITEVASKDYSAIIDVRSPAEFAQDHMPGAINCPVLSDAERAQVGTLYKQVSPFEARKVGAALIARNIARHIEAQFQNYPKHWRPLVYCWRGGQRSGAMQIILRQIGWPADRLVGGYKAFRHHVIAQTAQRAPALRWHMLCGATGSGKTRILQALAAQGAQVLDLETLAAHKGSVLGSWPHTPQPSQKAFETAVWQEIQGFDVARPVFAEAESRKIGQLQIPPPLLQAMRLGACIDVEATLPARTAFLLHDYAYVQQTPELLIAQLERLKERQGSATVAEWQALVREHKWSALIQALLQRHYDPHYRQSQHLNYQGPRVCEPVQVSDLSPASIQQIAQDILRCGADRP